MVFSTRFARPEHDIAIVDGIYPAAGPVRMHVFGHPYFAITDAKGKFALPTLPPGTYQIVCEHERIGRITGDIEVADGAPLSFDVVFDDSPQSSTASVLVKIRPIQGLAGLK